MRRATLSDVAREAGVSVTTASRALSGRGDLAASTRARVLRAADRHNYARAGETRGRPTTVDPRMIELVTGGFHHMWTDEVIVGAQRAASSIGCDLVLTAERDDPADDWPARIATRRSSGVVLAIIVPTRSQLATLRQLNIPVVLLDPRSEPHADLVSVGTTDFQGGADAAAHLLECGYERFALLRSAPPYRFGRERENGFRSVLREHGITEVTVLGSPDDVVTLRAAERVGLFVVMDDLAVMALEAAAAAGIAVPEQLGVVGFDNIGSALASDLTTIEQPVRRMAARAVELVHELRDSPLSPGGRFELPTRLVARGTTSSRAR